jgi:hypothetical protein
MTKAWGPLGWATLHSVAALYPDNPTDLEKSLIIKWFDSFRNCIVCSVCKEHFSALLREYIVLYPNWNASRKDLSLFVLRAHNTVNVRQLGRNALSMEEAFTRLRQNIDPSKAAAKRKSYIVYIRADWGKSLNFDGFTAAKYIIELIMIETDYLSSRPLFSWDEIRDLVNGENIEAIQGSKPPRTSIFNASRALPIPSIKQQLQVPSILPSGKPRFSFLSR